MQVDIIHSGIVPNTNLRLFVVIYDAQKMIPLEKLIEEIGGVYFDGDLARKGFGASLIYGWLYYWVRACDIQNENSNMLIEYTFSISIWEFSILFVSLI